MFLHHAVFWIIILAEAAVAALCWLGGIQLLITMNDASRFNQARRVAIAGLTLWILLLYLIQPDGPADADRTLVHAAYSNVIHSREILFKRRSGRTRRSYVSFMFIVRRSVIDLCSTSAL